MAKKPEPTPTASLQFSAYFRIFLTVAVGLMVANLFLTNDYNVLQPRAEVASLLRVVTGGAENLPQWLQAGIFEAFGFSPFGWRAVPVVFLLGGAWFFYNIGRRVFGEGTVVLTLLVLGSSLLVVNLAKFASADVPFLVLSMVLTVLTLLVLKQPEKNWKWYYLVALGAATATAPVSTVLFAAALTVGLLVAHPQRRRLPAPLLLGATAVAGGIAFVLNGFRIAFPDYQFIDLNLRTDYGGYAVAQVIGFLPWFGFLLAALWNVVVQWRRGEELSIIAGVWLIAALASGSAASQWVLALLIAKNGINYFKDGYPLRGLVQTGAVLQVVFVFFLASYQMIDGFERLGGAGFRVFMGISAAYWIPSIVALSGLVGKNRRTAIAGTAMSGILATLLYWILLNPIVQDTRNQPRLMVAAVRGMTEGGYFRKRIDEGVSEQSRVYLHGVFREDALQNALPGVAEIEFYGYRNDSLQFLQRHGGAEVLRVEDTWVVRR